MAVKIAINGFGRIGKLAFRQIFEDKNFEVVAINGTGHAADYAYQIKYDSANGVWKRDSVTHDEDAIYVDGKKVPVFSERDPKNLPWKELGVDVVLECTGVFRTVEGASAHVEAGAKKVIISAPTKDEETKVVVFGVNQEILSPSDKIISAASCTTNGLALMTKILVDEFGIQRGLMSGSRAYTATQNMQDASGGRKSRAGAQNVIPVTTGSANALGKVIPEVKGIITGTTTRVPVITAGFVELFSVLDREVTVDQINEVMKAAANDSYGYTEDEIVSSDVVGDTHGSVFDATLTEVLDANGGQLVKTVAWYDNEYGFVSNMIRLVEHFSKLV